MDGRIDPLRIVAPSEASALVTEMRSLLDTLIQHGFYVAPALYSSALKQVGEQP